MPRTSFRKKAEEIDRVTKEKMAKRTDALQSMQCQQNDFENENKSMSDKLNLWHSVLTKIVSHEHHGSKKEAGAAWLQYFEQVTGTKIADAPAPFESADMSYENSILCLSTHISLLRKELEKLEKQMHNLQKRIGKRKLTMEKREDQVKSKLRKVIEIKQAGKEEEVLEQKRHHG